MRCSRPAAGAHRPDFLADEASATQLAMALSAVPHAPVAASVTPRRHRGRHAAACERHAVRGGPCRAASDDASSSTRVEFEGRILQDVRAGQQGFATTLRVAGGSPGATPGEGASEGDLVTVAYTAAVTGDDDGPHTELEVGVTVLPLWEHSCKAGRHGTDTRIVCCRLRTSHSRSRLAPPTQWATRCFRPLMRLSAAWAWGTAPPCRHKGVRHSSALRLGAARCGTPKLSGCLSAPP